MRVSADPALPAALSKGERPAAPAAGEETQKFERLLRQAKKPRGPESSPADAAPRRMNWSSIAAALSGKAGSEDATDAADPDNDDKLAERKAGEGQPTCDDAHAPAPPMQNGGQWLLAAHDPDRGPVPPASTGSPHDSEGKTRGSGRAIPANMDAAVAGDAPLASAKMPATTATPVAAGQPRATPSFETPVGPAAMNEATRTVSVEPASISTKRPDATPPADKALAAVADKPSSKPVTVTAAQSFPAPAPVPVSQTITALAGAIASDGGMAPALAASAGLAQPGQAVAAASHLLKIELHPAELGVVTANLRLSGGQLSMELKPENQEAHRRLSADSEALAKSLQGLGFAVDKITVLQPSVAATATPRMDAAPGSAGRDASSFQPGNSGGNGESSGGQHFGRNRGNEGQHGGHGGTPLRDRAGGGLFI